MSFSGLLGVVMFGLRPVADGLQPPTPENIGLKQEGEHP